MRYFLDTEFNGFGGELIAIALVPEEEGLPFFYEAIACTSPVEWVAQHVIPVLQTRSLSRREVANRFAEYLEDDEAPLIVADWPEDVAHAARLLVTGPGEMKPIRSLRFELVDPEIIGPGSESATPHNALADATALRATMLAYEERMAW